MSNFSVLPSLALMIVSRASFKMAATGNGQSCMFDRHVNHRIRIFHNHSYHHASYGILHTLKQTIVMKCIKKSI